MIIKRPISLFSKKIFCKIYRIKFKMKPSIEYHH